MKIFKKLIDNIKIIKILSYILYEKMKASKY